MKYLIGLSALGYKENKNYLIDFENIIKKFPSEDITWYLSPPYSKELGSRKLDIDEYPILKEQVKIIKKYNQNLQLAFNTQNLSIRDWYSIFLRFKKDFGEVSSIVTLDTYIPFLLSLGIPLVYSFNNLTIKSNLKYCKAIVIGRRDIRNISLMRALKNRGLQIELLVNNGCHFYCNRKCGEDCKILQCKRISEIGKLRCLAEQSLFPEELNLYPEDIIDVIKISSRPSNLEYIERTFNDYSSRTMSLSLKDLENINKWRYYSRLSNLRNAFYKNEIVPVFEVIDKKEQIWMEIYKDNENMKEKVHNVFESLKKSF